RRSDEVDDQCCAAERRIADDGVGAGGLLGLEGNLALRRVAGVLDQKLLAENCLIGGLGSGNEQTRGEKCDEQTTHARLRTTLRSLSAAIGGVSRPRSRAR